LTQLRTTLGTLNTSLGLAKPSLAALRPVAPLVRPALSELIQLSGPAIKLLHEAPGLLDDADRALPAITRFTSAFHPALKVILPAAEQLAPVIAYVSLYKRELTSAMALLAADLEATAPANTLSGTAHYLRSTLTLSNESIYGQSVREPNNRSNTYYSPGELANIANGLYSGSCANTSNKSQVPVPILNQNVPCKVQPPFHWGSEAPTTPTAYYPHVTAAKP
jgi:hypothetical protein